jgi:hypothetical protein
LEQRRPRRRARPAGDEVARAPRALRTGSDLSGALVEIHRIENEADRVMRDGVASLFVNGIDPRVVIRWKDIFESLEASVDACETVAHILEGIASSRAADPGGRPSRPRPAGRPRRSRPACAAS